MKRHPKRLAMPAGWPAQVKSILIHIISMAHIAMLYARSRSKPKRNSDRITARLRQAVKEINLLREELRIKDARMGRIPANNRPHYTSTERLTILELKAARGWSDSQAAEVFMICPQTTAYWAKRLDDTGAGALLQMPQPVNKLPDFIRYIVGRLKVLCPAMGKVRIAQALTKAGFILSASTVGRILKSSTNPPKKPDSCSISRQTVYARYPNHIWHIDLTVIPTSGGFWISWLPFAVPQVWPFCWWLACILDQYSRCIIGFAVFKKQPTAAQMRCFLMKAIRKVNCRPGHIITDKGVQFKSKTFRKWCKRKGIVLRYGAVGRYGSIALIERFFKTIKSEWLRKIIISLDMSSMRRRLTAYIRWYNCYRPHQGLDGAVPAEVYDPRLRKENTLKFGEDNHLQLIVSFYDGDKQLPIIRLRQAA